MVEMYVIKHGLSINPYVYCIPVKPFFHTGISVPCDYDGRCIRDDIFRVDKLVSYRYIGITLLERLCMYAREKH